MAIIRKRPWPRIHGTPPVRSGRNCATTSITFPRRTRRFLRRSRRIANVGLGDLPLIFGRIESVEPPDFLRARERLHRQIGMRAPKFGAEARGLLLDLPICIFTTGYQRLASDQKYRRRYWYRLHLASPNRSATEIGIAAIVYLGCACPRIVACSTIVCSTSNGKDFIGKYVREYRGEEFYRASPAVRDRCVLTANGLAPFAFAAETFRALAPGRERDIETYKKLYSRGLLD
jgi:hypothetical protein